MCRDSGSEIEVLWVEDEPHTLRYERRLAEAFGWRITTCDTVEQAIHLLKTNSYDLVIVDLMLPMDEYNKRRGFLDPGAGVALLTHIRDPRRDDATPPSVTTLVITAVISSDTRAEVLNYVDDRHFLSKPVDEKQYIETVQEITKYIAEADIYSSD